MSKTTLQNLAILLEVGAIVALVLLIIRSIPEHFWEKRELNENYQKWRSQAITHYRVLVDIGCFCEFSSSMPVVVEVNDGKIISVVDAQGNVLTDDSVILTYYRYLLTVDDAFGYAYGSFSNADSVIITYDDQLGYPTHIGIDRNKEEVDDEMGIKLFGVESIP